MKPSLSLDHDIAESETRTDWTREEIAALYDLPFDELMWEAQGVHRRHHARGEVQLCTLLSIKTGGCVEDCGYCSQSKSADSGLKATKLMDVRAVLQAAAQAKDSGSKRFCMGAAWRNPKDRDMPAIVEMVEGVRRADAAGIRSSVIVLLGLGGKERSAEHVRETVRALNRMQPRHLSFLSLMLIPGTPLWEEARRGRFVELDSAGLLREARDILAGLDLRRTVFRSDHASNHLFLEGRLPADRDKLVRALDLARAGGLPTRPDSSRGL